MSPAPQSSGTSTSHWHGMVAHYWGAKSTTDLQCRVLTTWKEEATDPCSAAHAWHMAPNHRTWCTTPSPVKNSNTSISSKVHKHYVGWQEALSCQQYTMEIRYSDCIVRFVGGCVAIACEFKYSVAMKLATHGWVIAHHCAHLARAYGLLYSVTLCPSVSCLGKERGALVEAQLLKYFVYACQHLCGCSLQSMHMFLLGGALSGVHKAANFFWLIIMFCLVAPYDLRSLHVAEPRVSF